MRGAADMIKALERALNAQTVNFMDASDEEITAFVADMLAQLSILIEFTAIPSARKVRIRRAIETIGASIVVNRAHADPKCDWPH